MSSKIQRQLQSAKAEIEKLKEEVSTMEKIKSEHEKDLRKKDEQYEDLLRAYNRLRVSKKHELECLALQKLRIENERDNVLDMLDELIFSNGINLSRALYERQISDTSYRYDLLRHELGTRVVQRISDDANIPLATQILNYLVDMNFMKIKNNRLEPLCNEYETTFKKMEEQKKELKKRMENKEKQQKLSKYEKIQKTVTKESIEEMRENVEVLYQLYPECSDVENVRDKLSRLDVEEYIDSVKTKVKNIEEGKMDTIDKVEEVIDDDFMSTYNYLIEDMEFINHQKMESKNSSSSRIEWEFSDTSENEEDSSEYEEDIEENSTIGNSSSNSEGTSSQNQDEMENSAHVKNYRLSLMKQFYFEYSRRNRVEE